MTIGSEMHTLLEMWSRTTTTQSIAPVVPSWTTKTGQMKAIEGPVSRLLSGRNSDSRMTIVAICRHRCTRHILQSQAVVTIERL